MCSCAHRTVGACGYTMRHRYCRRRTMTKTSDGHDGPLDRLTISGIEGFGHNGVFEAERRDGQPFLAVLRLEVDTRRAARSDDLQDTVDYGNLVARVVKAIESDPVDLIETLAERI